MRVGTVTKQRRKKVPKKIAKKERYTTLPLHKLVAGSSFRGEGPLDVRDLVASFRSGTEQIVPIIASPLGDGTYEIVSGHRRWTALKEVGAPTAKVQIRYLDKRQRHREALEDNLNRKDLPGRMHQFAQLARMRAEESPILRGDFFRNLTKPGSRSTESSARAQIYKELQTQTGLGLSTIRRILTMAERGIPEVVKAHIEGRLEANIASEISSLPKDQQLGALNHVSAIKEGDRRSVGKYKNLDKVSFTLAISFETSIAIREVAQARGGSSSKWIRGVIVKELERLKQQEVDHAERSPAL